MSQEYSNPKRANDVCALADSGGVMRLLRTGDLAYADSFIGLIPCKVLAIDDAENVTIRTTAARRGWRKGEQNMWRALHVIPRNAVRRTKYGTRVLPYSILTDAGKTIQLYTNPYNS